MSLRYHDTIIHGGLAEAPDDINRALSYTPQASRPHRLTLPSLPFEFSTDIALTPMACLNPHTDTGCRPLASTHHGSIRCEEIHEKGAREPRKSTEQPCSTSVIYIYTQNPGS